MKSQPVLLLLLFILATYNQISAKYVGNDIIVNIGQTNGNNHNNGNGYSKPNGPPGSAPSNNSGPPHNNGGPPVTPAPSNPPAKPSQNDQPAPSNAPRESICTASGQTIQVDSNAVQGHLQAGAKLGTCPKTQAPTPKATSSPTTIPVTSPPPPTNAPFTPAPTSEDLPSNSTTRPPRPTPAPSSANVNPAPSKAPEAHIPVCLPHVDTTVMIPANILGQFLAKGATIGNCTVTPAPTTMEPSKTPAPTPAAVAPAPIVIQQAQPSIIVPKPIRISPEECDTPQPGVLSVPRSRAMPSGPTAAALSPPAAARPAGQLGAALSAQTAARTPTLPKSMPISRVNQL